MSDVSYVDLSTGGVDGPGLETDASGDTLGAYPTNVGVGPFQTPPSPIYAAEDYLAALQALMPRGRAWPTDPDSIQAQVLGGFAPTLERVNQVAGALMVDIFPASSVNLLTDWEESLGLPDPCDGESPILQVRQNSVLTRLINTGGQSVPYLIAIAGVLGYDITITEYGSSNPHHFQVNAPVSTVRYFRVGQSLVGEPLVSGGNAVLECLIRELKPAHTTVSFNYA